MTKKFLFAVAASGLFVSSAAFAQIPCQWLARELAAEGEATLPVERTSLRFTRDIKPGVKSPLVPLVRSSLGLPAEGDYDEEVTATVKSFQERSGLTPTGTVDGTTFMRLVPLSVAYRTEAARQTAQECERVNTAVVRDNPGRFIEVNVASQTLVAYERNSETGGYTEVLRSRVVVGAVNTQTPVEDFTLWALKFNPGWTPTTNILSRNVVRGGQINHKWLTSHNMRAFDRAGNPVELSSITPGNWRQFRFSEPPGERAALGKLKFETTSGKNIYMHDTPEKRKFDWNLRVASSGCVRVQEIEALARWAFRAEDEDSDAGRQFDGLLAKGKNAVKRLDAPIPVYLTYRLVDFDAAGRAQFYIDAYHRTDLVPSID